MYGNQLDRDRFQQDPTPEGREGSCHARRQPQPSRGQGTDDQAGGHCQPQSAEAPRLLMLKVYHPLAHR
jgi:hypothetical protein